MRPSDTYKLTAVSLAKALRPIAQAAKVAGDLDKVALSYALAALEGIEQWSRDTTETTRRKAHGNAVACQALAASRLAGGDSLTRQALAGFGAALEACLDAQPVKALQLADAARNRLYV